MRRIHSPSHWTIFKIKYHAREIKIDGTFMSVLPFADDITLLSEDINNIMLMHQQQSQNQNEKINCVKTKIIEFTRILIEGVIIERFAKCN